MLMRSEYLIGTNFRARRVLEKSLGTNFRIGYFQKRDIYIFRTIAMSIDQEKNTKSRNCLKCRLFRQYLSTNEKNIRFPKTVQIIKK